MKILLLYNSFQSFCHLIGVMKIMKCSIDLFFRGGICIWAASFPGNAASIRSGAPSFVGTLPRGTGVRWTLVDFLRSDADEQITALSWSPDGRYPLQTNP